MAGKRENREKCETEGASARTWVGFEALKETPPFLLLAGLRTFWMSRAAHGPRGANRGGQRQAPETGECTRIRVAGIL